MKVLIHNRHTPHLWTMINAMPEIEWVIGGWNDNFRTRPSGRIIKAVEDLIDASYDAIIDDDVTLPAYAAQAPVRIYLEHCEHDGGNQLRHSHLCAAFTRSTSVVSVSEHKRATMRELGNDPKCHVIRLHVPPSEFPLRKFNPSRLVGTAHNFMNDAMADLFRQLTDGFERVIIGFGNERHGFPTYEPKSFSDYKNKMMSLGVFVYTSVGEQLGCCPTEAMMMGIPVVTGSQPEAWNFMFSDYNAFIHRNAPKDCVPWCRERISELLNNPDKAKSMGRAGREAVMQYCTLQEFRRGWFKVLGY